MDNLNFWGYIILIVGLIGLLILMYLNIIDMNGLNFISSIASIAGLFLTVLVFIGIGQIKQYYFVRIRLPKLLSRLREIREEFESLKPNDENIIDLLGKLSGCIDNLKDKNIQNKKHLAVIGEFKKNRNDNNYTNLKFNLSRLIEYLDNYVEDINIKGTL